MGSALGRGARHLLPPAWLSGSASAGRSLASFLAEPNIQDFLTAYRDELWPCPDIPVVFEWDGMAEEEARGVYKVWTAHVGPTLVGYVSFYIKPYANAKTTLFAADGGHFLMPDVRDTRARIGWRMWKTAALALKAEGVKVLMMHDNTSRSLAPFFLGLGAEPRSVVYWLRLG